MMVKKEDKRKDKIKDGQLHISVNKEEKEEAQRILEECGTTINSVVQMLLKHIINHKGIPFPVMLPDNAENENRPDQAEEEEEIRESYREPFLTEEKNDGKTIKKEGVFCEDNPETAEEEEIQFLNLFEADRTESL